MKRVIALSLLALVFVCFLHSVDLNIEYFSIEENGDNSFDYSLHFQEKPDTVAERFVFRVGGKPISMFWTLPKPSGIPESTHYSLEVVSNSYKSCFLTLYMKGDNNWTFTTGNSNKPYDLIDFLKILLKDGYIVYTLSPYTTENQKNKDSQRFFLSIAKTEDNEKARQEALEKLELYDEYLFIWEYKEFVTR